MNVYLYVFDTLADWEIAYLTAEVHSRRFFADRNIECHLIKVGNNRSPVTTMGGMTITPDITIDAMNGGKDDILVLPGGDTWMNAEHDRILELAKRRIEADLPVAAICGGTIGLARTGSLNVKKHTSNDMNYLKHVAKQYIGERNYVNRAAVNDRNLITASGQSAVEFTYEVLKTLKLFKSDTLEAWRGLYLTNEARYFFDMMKSLEPQNGQ